MTNSKINTEFLSNLTKTLFHECYKGNLDLWFSYLTKDSVYLGSGSPILFGDIAIKTHFKSLIGNCGGKILHEEYFPIELSKSLYTVNGKIVLKGENSIYTATTYFTIIYRIDNNKPTILQQHNSYEYHNSLASNTSLLKSNKGKLNFINDILLQQNGNQRIEIRSSGQSQFIDPCTILYIQGIDKKTEYICVDRIIISNKSLKEIIKALPSYFYQTHRSYIINTKYIVSVKRFEVELVTGVKLPIPEKSYTKIKNDLKSIISNKAI